jgi:hypothetical protein
MLELLEQAAMHDYPNPERKGCPGFEFLQRLADDRTSIALDDSRLTHVARCSPCYREFVSYRKSLRQKVITRRTLITTGSLAVASLIIVGVRTVHKPGSEAWTQETIDLSNNQVTRGTEIAPIMPKFTLPAKRLDLSVTLPLASPEGDYQVEVLSADRQSIDVRASGRAFLKDGKTSLHVRLDLTSLRPASYQIGIRRVPYDWLPIPIQVR